MSHVRLIFVEHAVEPCVPMNASNATRIAALRHALRDPWRARPWVLAQHRTTGPVIIAPVHALCYMLYFVLRHQEYRYSLRIFSIPTDTLYLKDDRNIIVQ